MTLMLLHFRSVKQHPLPTSPARGGGEVAPESTFNEDAVPLAGDVMFFDSVVTVLQQRAGMTTAGYTDRPYVKTRLVGGYFMCPRTEKAVREPSPDITHT